MPRGMIDTLCTGSAPGSASATSAWPISWIGDRPRARCGLSTRLRFSRPATMRSIAAVKSSSVTCVGLAPRRHQRRLVDQVGEVGAGEAGGQRRRPASRSTPRRELSPCAHAPAGSSTRPLLVGPVDQHLAVEAAGAQQRRVEDLRPVGGGQQHHADARVEAVESRPAAGSASAPSRRGRRRPGKAPRARPSASSSSMKMMPAPSRAPARTGRAPAPRRRRRTSRRTREPEIEKNGTPASPATARASSVLPVPGGPDQQHALGHARAQPAVAPSGPSGSRRSPAARPWPRRRRPRRRRSTPVSVST